MNVGDYADAYSDLPPNVVIDGWFPQPSVISQTDVVIHHGGNNSFTECLYFAKPAIIMPYVWDGHDNATRVQETGHGLHLDRYEWNDEALIEAVETCLGDSAIRSKLQATSAPHAEPEWHGKGRGSARIAPLRGHAGAGIARSMPGVPSRSG